MGDGHAHEHGREHRREHGNEHSADADRRWLTAALAVLLAFMIGELIAGLAVHSLALLADAGHMTTDAAALFVAIIAARIAVRPARGAYTYGFTRVDALSGQANGITLLILAVIFAITGVRRLIDPVDVGGGTVTIVAAIGVVVNVVAVLLAGRADRRSLNVRGAMAHLVTDLWAFIATFAAGVVVLTTDWVRADAVASLFVAVLMAWTGLGLVRAAGRVFLEAAPSGIDPAVVGAGLASVAGVAEVHDLHVWQLGSAEIAASAHVLVDAPFDCHEVSSRMRDLLRDDYDIRHVTLQADHADAPAHLADDCADAHGAVHIAPSAQSGVE